jgi:Uma2 family endonuclease
MLARNVHWTEEEYLRFEEASTTRHEYLEGEIYAMAGAKSGHNKIATNAIAALSVLVRAGRRGQAFNSDQRLHVPGSGLYTYADGGVACGKWEILERDGMSLLNPVLLVEVLSPSTCDDDRGAKLIHYRQIASLTSVLILHEPERRVEHHRRVDGGWALDVVTSGAIDLPTLGGSLALDDLYYVAAGA